MLKQLSTLLIVVLVNGAAKVYAADYGTTGLINIPTAYMSEDATLTSTMAFQDRTDSYALTYQLAPWAEATFRYTKYNNFFFYDRNYEVKLRLVEESYYFPQLSLGMRDLIGTGVVAAEYLVASKKLGNFSLTAGLGWGGFAGSSSVENPLGNLFDRFAVRDREEQGIAATGRLQSGLFFSGQNVGVFGGLAYDFEAIPLRLMVERNPDQYDFEASRGVEEPKSVVSWGLELEPFDGVVLGLNQQHGEEWGLSLALKTDTSELQKNKAQHTPPSSARPPAWIDTSSWYDSLLFAMEQAGLFLFEGSISENGQIAHLLIGNQQFQLQADAINRATVLADIHLPPSVQSIMFTLREYGHEALNVKVARPSTLRERKAPPIDYYARLSPPESIDNPQHRTSFFTGKTAFDITLANRLQFFDPDNPLRYQFAVRLGAALELPGGASLKGSYAVDIDNNFDEITRKSDSVLPHVRSDVAEYLQQGDSGLESLYLDKRGDIADNIYYRGYAGVLEEMYSGVGYELLVQPYKSRVAFGLSTNWVKQRAFDKSFKHRDYSTFTAFFSLFWATPFYNYDMAVHAGRYLADDVGATFEVRRTFDNGWSLGAWATFTDVSSEEFGEGSFDKGFFFRIPFDVFTSRNTRASYQTRIRPVQRDGGQRLEDFSGSLWFDLRASRFDAISNNKDRMKVQ